MRKYLVALTLIVLSGVAPLLPRPSLALSCAHPRDQLNDYALIVEGHVTKLEQGVGASGYDGTPPDRVTLAVNRYLTLTLGPNRAGSGSFMLSFRQKLLGPAKWVQCRLEA